MNNMDNDDDDEDDVDGLKSGGGQKPSNATGDIACDAFSNSRMSFGNYYNNIIFYIFLKYF